MGGSLGLPSFQVVFVSFFKKKFIAIFFFSFFASFVEWDCNKVQQI
jgi:hypothetical protein